MKYYIAKTVSGTFPATVERVIESLKAEGFGVLTEIDAPMIRSERCCLAT